MQARKDYLAIFISSFIDDFGTFLGIYKLHVTDDHYTTSKLQISLDCQRPAARQGGHTFRNKFFKPVDEFVAMFQFYNWRCGIPIWDKLQSKFRAQLVCIGANAQKVSR